MKKCTIYNGGLATDDRGTLRFVNDFDFSGVKRFYQVENHTRGFIRAWHGHKIEEKWVYVVKGSIILYVADMETKEIERFVLSATNPKIVKIPASKYNGFKTLEENTIVIFFSSLYMDEAKNDDIRQPVNFFDIAIWDVEFR